MRIADLLQKPGILVNFKAQDKTDALTRLAHYLASLYDLKTPEYVAQKVLARESEMSTGIGYGIAIPHARIDGLDRLYMVAASISEGIEFDAIDEQPVHLIFMMLSPTNTSVDHTRILSSLSRIMSYEEIRTGLREAQTPDEFLEIIVRGEDRYVE